MTLRVAFDRSKSDAARARTHEPMRQKIRFPPEAVSTGRATNGNLNCSNPLEYGQPAHIGPDDVPFEAADHARGRYRTRPHLRFWCRAPRPGIEPATPSLLRCAGGSQRRTAPHVTRQPRRWEGASESRDVGRDAVTRSAVSANFWHGQLELEMDTTPQRHLPGRPREDHTHLRCGAVLGTIFGSCVERAGEASSLMAGAGPWPVKCCDGPCRWVSSGPSLNRHRVDEIVARLQAVEWPTAMADFLLADAAGQQPL
jgi:hypothetical protein